MVHKSTLFITLCVPVVCYLLKDELQKVYTKINNFVVNKPNDTLVKVFLKTDLALFDGEHINKLYLAFLGNVFDVTKGSVHYKKGSSYNYFIGKDGSRAFVSGNFEDVSENMDHVLDFSCNDLSNLMQWNETLSNKYKHVGVLNGRYYERNGLETEYLKSLHIRLKECDAENEKDIKENLKYPPCNIEWVAEEGTRVWCSKMSGGIRRNWVGVPRQLFTPGVNTPRCACINLDTNSQDHVMLKEYENCHLTATSCKIKA